MKSKQARIIKTVIQAILVVTIGYVIRHKIAETHAPMWIAAGWLIALPITSVLETIMLERSDILTVERREVIQLRETTLPLLRLGKFFAIEGASDVAENPYVVVVGAAEKRLGIVVDDLLGQQDIVIKSMGETLKGCRGISGAADLGDQRTILVLDVGGIINEATKGNA